MYAVVAIGSRMRRSACGMNFRTFCWAVAAHGAKAAAHSSAVAMRLIEPVDRKKRLIIGTLIYWNKIGPQRAIAAPAPFWHRQSGVRRLGIVVRAATGILRLDAAIAAHGHVALRWFQR